MIHLRATREPTTFPWGDLMAQDRPLRADAVRNRQKILAAAREQITLHGPDASMDAIAGAAGVAVGTLYRHFPTKTDLVSAVVTEHIEGVAADAEAANARAASGSSALAEITAFIGAVLEAAANDRAVKTAAHALGAAPAPRSRRTVPRRPWLRSSPPPRPRANSIPTSPSRTSTCSSPPPRPTSRPPPAPAGSPSSCPASPPRAGAPPDETAARGPRRAPSGPGGGTPHAAGGATGPKARRSSTTSTVTRLSSPSLSVQQHPRELVVDLALDGAAQRAGAVLRLVAVPGQPVDGLRGELDRDVLGVHPAPGLLQQQVGDLPQLSVVELPEDHDLVDAVEELRPEVLAQRPQDPLARGLLVRLRAARCRTRAGAAAPAMASEPRLLVITMTVLVKSTVRPCESVSRPSSSTWSRMLKTSGCAFSTSSRSSSEYGLRRTASVSCPASSWPT